MNIFNISEIAKKMIKTQAILCAIATIVICFFVGRQNILWLIFGATVGCILSQVKIVLLEKTINKVVDMGKNDASVYMKSQYFSRYLLSFVVLFLLARTNVMSLYGGCVALMSMQITAYVVNIGNKKNANA